MMKGLRNFTALGIGAAGLIVLVAASPARGTERQHQAPHAISPFGHALQMSTFYTEDMGSIGEFPGTVLCLHTGREFLPTPVDQCAQKDHVYALSMQDGSMVHPLLAGDPQALKKLPQLVGKKVVADGKYYESIGMILAGNIRSRG
jgi:hypothetical protein